MGCIRDGSGEGVLQTMFWGRGVQRLRLCICHQHWYTEILRRWTCSTKCSEGSCQTNLSLSVTSFGSVAPSALGIKDLLHQKGRFKSCGTSGGSADKLKSSKHGLVLNIMSLNFCAVQIVVVHVCLHGLSSHLRFIRRAIMCVSLRPQSKSTCSTRRGYPKMPPL